MEKLSQVDKINLQVDRKTANSLNEEFGSLLSDYETEENLAANGKIEDPLSIKTYPHDFFNDAIIPYVVRRSLAKVTFDKKMTDIRNEIKNKENEIINREKDPDTARQLLKDIDSEYLGKLNSIKMEYEEVVQHIEDTSPYFNDEKWKLLAGSNYTPIRIKCDDEFSFLIPPKINNFGVSVINDNETNNKLTNSVADSLSSYKYAAKAQFDRLYDVVFNQFSNTLSVAEGEWERVISKYKEYRETKMNLSKTNDENHTVIKATDNEKINAFDGYDPL